MIGAVDIGGTKIAVGIVDDNGTVLSKQESPTQAQRGYSYGLERIVGNPPAPLATLTFCRDGKGTIRLKI